MCRVLCMFSDPFDSVITLADKVAGKVADKAVGNAGKIKINLYD